MLLTSIPLTIFPTWKERLSFPLAWLLYFCCSLHMRLLSRINSLSPRHKVWCLNTCFIEFLKIVHGIIFWWHRTSSAVGVLPVELKFAQVAFYDCIYLFWLYIWLFFVIYSLYSGSCKSISSGWHSWKCGWKLFE